jgi:hypothetical protein
MRSEAGKKRLASRGCKQYSSDWWLELLRGHVQRATGAPVAILAFLSWGAGSGTGDRACKRPRGIAPRDGSARSARPHRCLLERVPVRAPPILIYRSWKISADCHRRRTLAGNCPLNAWRYIFSLRGENLCPAFFPI